MMNEQVKIWVVVVTDTKEELPVLNLRATSKVIKQLQILEDKL
jgi:hypothetical protein